MSEPTTFSAWDPESWMKQVSAAMQLAPKTLVQPILPGWTLNVNAFNSSAPQTEAEILQQHSYGRQIGRISDALAALIDDADGSGKDGRFEEFRKLHRSVLEIKGGSAERRAQRLLADLDVLRVADREAHDRLLGEIEQQLAARRSKPKRG